MTTPHPRPASLPTPTERAAMLRTVYRYFHAYGIASATDRLVRDTAVEELTALGWTLNEDESDWQPPTEGEHDGR